MAQVAKAVGFLASQDSGTMTGSAVHFDQSVWEGYPFAPPTLPTLPTPAESLAL